MERKTTPAIYSPRFDANEEKYGNNSNSCFCCARPTDEKLFVHLLTTGELTNQEDATNEPKSQGFFPIGTTCAKKYPKEFIFSKK